MDGFALYLGQEFFDEVCGSGKAHTLLSAPPKRQVVTGDRLDWKEAKPIAEVSVAMPYVLTLAVLAIVGGEARAPAGGKETGRVEARIPV